MSKYCGLYKGTVISNQDPTGQMRIVARVAQLFGPTGQTGWALPCYPLAMVAPPKMGDPVWIMFESGDEDHPVYMGAWSSWDTQIAEATVANLPTDLSTINTHLSTIDGEITAINNGTSGLPATTVTGPAAFGAAPVVGTSTKYARADHIHGLPAAPMPGQELGWKQVTTADQSIAADGNGHDITGLTLTVTATSKMFLQAKVGFSTPGGTALVWVNFELFEVASGAQVETIAGFPLSAGNWQDLTVNARLPNSQFTPTPGTSYTFKGQLGFNNTGGSGAVISTSGDFYGHHTWIRAVAC